MSFDALLDLLESEESKGSKLGTKFRTHFSFTKLPKCNRMTIDPLLNPEGESHVSTETSDNEIFQAVMDLIAARESLEVIGGDDVDEDIPVEPLPTRRDVLKAVSTIKRYTEDMGDPFSCKVDTILGSFN
ncbi:hypothetical protein BDQ17DRAFT_1361557 [Cyathus striatus]|nr:hypothetical protein BDQ17DRAFT_1361557 [Cyathus striatus]